MDIKERFIQFIEYKKLSKRKFQESIGVSNSYIQNISTGIGVDVLKRIRAAYPELDTDWLLTGTGEMLKASSGTSEESSPARKGIPFYVDLPVSAGRLDTIIQDAEPSGWLDIPGVRALALFPVVGCSMKPEINPGDVIGVTPLDTWEHIDPDKAYLIITHDDRMIKHLAPDDSDADSLWCISPNYPKFKIQKSDIHYIYRVTFCGKLM